MSHRTTSRAAELVAAGIPFARATVVRAQSPTSALPGDDAIVLADASMEGFVGGQCAEESVRNAALDSLEHGEPLLLRVLPPGDAEFPAADGARVVVNPCQSGGALEIFLEPVVPPALVHLVGLSPTADAIAALAATLGLAVSRAPSGTGPRGAVAVVVSSHGHDEEPALRAALAAGVGFIGLVASRRRGDAVLAAMDLDEAERLRIRTPVGLEIGARTPEEIALSILAEIVRAIRVEGLRRPATMELQPPTKHLDSICGMVVVAAATTPRAVLDGDEHWFCSDSCKSRFLEQAAL